MRRLAVPAIAAAAVFALSLLPATDRPTANDPTRPAAPDTISTDTTAANPIVAARPCHFLRIAPSRDLDPGFVMPLPPSGGWPGVAVPDGPGLTPGVIVRPDPTTPTGESCHTPPPMVPLDGR